MFRKWRNPLILSTLNYFSYVISNELSTFVLTFQSSTSSYCQVATLTIQTVTPAHSGEYNLIVGSGKTLVEATVILSVTKSTRNREPVQTSSSHTVCSIMFDNYIIMSLVTSIFTHLNYYYY